MRITGSSMGSAPAARRCSLNKPAYSRVRVTSTRLSRSWISRACGSDMLLLLYIVCESCDYRIRALSQRYIGHRDAQFLGPLNTVLWLPERPPAHAHLFATVQARYQATQAQF